MPITKFSWAGLKENIRKYALVYFACIAIALTVTNLVWTMTRPRIPADQSVTIYIATEYSNPEALDDVAALMFEGGKAVDEDLQEVVFYSLNYGDPAQDYTGSMVMATRLATGEGDAYICNRYSLANLEAGGAALDLTPYLEAGWLEGLDVEIREVNILETDNTGEIIGIAGTYPGAISLDNVDGLYKKGAVMNDDACLVIASNGTNVESTLEVVEIMLRTLMEE